MGVVWVAHHLALDVHVALKLIHPDAGSDTAARRLVQEAQAAARIDHPAVHRVLDVDRTASGDPFLVMELLEGECLAEVLRRERRLDPVIAVRTILPIVEALSALHAKGIVHRDVKPENIFLAQSDSRRWQPKLIDFGAVKLRERSTQRRISESGAFVGTPIYMSPEQVQGMEADARSDLFSLSVVLYEAIAGAPPFSRETVTSLFAELFADNPRPLSGHGVRDPELWTILRRGLAPHASRWPSARDLGAALVGWLRARGVTADIGDVTLWPVTSAAPASPAGTAGTPASAASDARRSPLAETLRMTLEPRPVRAPEGAGRKSSQRGLVLGLAAVVGAGVIAASLRPPAKASIAAASVAAPLGPPAPAPPGPVVAPRALAPPRPVDAPRRAPRTRGAGIPPELKDPYR
jgi:serine/threonine-protein kinase